MTVSRLKVQLECVLRDEPPMVSPERARRVMETYLAADLSAESGTPINLPLDNQALSAIQELYKKFRTPVSINPKLLRHVIPERAAGFTRVRLFHLSKSATADLDGVGPESIRPCARS